MITDAQLEYAIRAKATQERDKERKQRIEAIATACYANMTKDSTSRTQAALDAVEMARVLVEVLDETT